jgi:membrane complex biogenesis BtpA family protein
MNFDDLFGKKKPVIACLHLLPLPGAPRFAGRMQAVYDTALTEAAIFKREGVDGLIVENFRDKPFYPGKIPSETVAALSAVTREIVKASALPVGVNALRNDAQAAMAVAAATGAHFIRVNVHMGAVVSEQGVIQGASHETLRLRAALHATVLIFADVGVKHAAPLADRGLAAEAKDLSERGMADAVIVSGDLTGVETKPEDVDIVRSHTRLPILIGSGTTPKNLPNVFQKADGFIVGSYFKKAGKGENLVEQKRVKAFMRTMGSLSRVRAKRL